MIKGVSFVAVISNSFAIFWVGTLMILLFSFSLDIFPARSTPLTSPGDPFYALDLLPYDAAFDYAGYLQALQFGHLSCATLFLVFWMKITYK